MIKSTLTILVRAFLLFSVSACFYQTKVNPPIHFIVPDDFIGAFQLVLDEKEGVEIELKKGGYTYEIPQNRILKVKTFKPFHGWHKETAAYRNGRTIPTEDYSTVLSETIALRALGTSRTNDGPLIQTNVIGTAAEAKRIQRQLDAGRQVIPR
jgi:hypothetical protein